MNQRNATTVARRRGGEDVTTYPTSTTSQQEVLMLRQSSDSTATSSSSGSSPRSSSSSSSLSKAASAPLSRLNGINRKQYRQQQQQQRLINKHALIKLIIPIVFLIAVVNVNHQYTKMNLTILLTSSLSFLPKYYYSSSNVTSLQQQPQSQLCPTHYKFPNKHIENKHSPIIFQQENVMICRVPKVASTELRYISQAYAMDHYNQSQYQSDHTNHTNQTIEMMRLANNISNWTYTIASQQKHHPAYHYESMLLSRIHNIDTFHHYLYSDSRGDTSKASGGGGGGDDGDNSDSDTNDNEIIHRIMFVRHPIYRIVSAYNMFRKDHRFITLHNNTKFIGSYGFYKWISNPKGSGASLLTYYHPNCIDSDDTDYGIYSGTSSSSALEDNNNKMNRIGDVSTTYTSNDTTPTYSKSFDRIANDTIIRPPKTLIELSTHRVIEHWAPPQHCRCGVYECNVKWTFYKIDDEEEEDTGPNKIRDTLLKYRISSKYLPPYRKKTTTSANSSGSNTSSSFSGELVNSRSYNISKYLNIITLPILNEITKQEQQFFDYKPLTMEDVLRKARKGQKPKHNRNQIRP